MDHVHAGVLTNLREDDVLEASDIHPYSLELSRFAFPENPKLGELLTLGQRLVADGCHAAARFRTWRSLGR